MIIAIFFVYKLVIFFITVHAEGLMTKQLSEVMEKKLLPILILASTMMNSNQQVHVLIRQNALNPSNLASAPLCLAMCINSVHATNFLLW